MTDWFRRVEVLPEGRTVEEKERLIGRGEARSEARA
jgi:hypothetical protein